MATLTEIRSRVKLALHGKTNVDDEIDDAINAAIVQFIMEIKPQDVYEEVILKTNTSTATAEYAFSSAIWGTNQDTALSDLLAVVMVRNDTRDEQILRGGLRQYNRVRQDTTDSSNIGDPHRWTRRANTLILYGLLPDTEARTLTVTYLKRPAALSADADVFPLNREWERPVVKLATSMMWADLGDLGRADMTRAQYERMLMNMDKPEAFEDEAPEASVVLTSNLVV